MKLAIFILITIFLSNNIFANETKITKNNHIQKFQNLTWENKENAKLVEKSWDYAQKYCKNLNVENKKWRLPTFNELKSYNNHSNTRNIVQDDYYWSSTKNPKDENEALIFDISNQNSCEALINEDNYYILCVTQNK